MERWLIINDFPDYEVSSEGRIRNIKTGRILKEQEGSNGYSQVCLRHNNKQYTRKIHRLLADTFYDGDHTNRDVNHIDGNKKNNFIGNLEFCTRKENINHAFRTGLKTPSRQIMIRVVETGRVYNSIRECGKDMDINQSDICKCLSGKYDHCKGYHFERVEL